MAQPIVMRSDHYPIAEPGPASADESLEEVDVAVIGGGPGGLSAGVSMSIADPTLRIRVLYACALVQKETCRLAIC